MKLRSPFSAVAVAGILVSGLLLSCNLTDRQLGSAPIGPSGDGTTLDTTGNWTRDSVSGNMRVFATPQTVKAGNKDKATVTARVFDGNGNPVRGRLVRFAASVGTITGLDTTDAEGIATATYTPVPRNGEARILAAATVNDTLAVVGTSIQLEGLVVKVTPASPDTLIDKAVPVLVTVTDGEGEPVAAASVSLSGARQASGVTDGAGRLQTSVIRTEPGQAQVRASALGGADSVTVGFWSTPPDSRSRTILLFAEPARIAAVNGETSTIRAVVYDDNHNPVSGRTVTFTASHGIITPSDTTDAGGNAQAVFRGLAQNVDASITASVALADSLRRATITLTQAGLQVELRPAATEVKVGDTVALNIRVSDADGNPMPNVAVTLSGALQSSVRTGASGTAVGSVTSGGERAVPLKAAALGGSDSARVIFLTDLPTGGEAKKAGVGNLRIFVESSQLKASNTDQTQVRVVAFDKFNNPLAGRLVRFTANHGIITASDTTDSRGEAVAVYRAVPLNVNARITATMVVEDSALAVATTVSLSGLEVEIRPEVTDALLNRTVPVNIRIVDGAGSPVPDATILFNGDPGVGTTDGTGVFHTSVTQGAKGRKVITASALGDSADSFVDFWDVLPVKGGDVTTIRHMRIFSSRSQLRADNSDFALVTVILTNEQNNPAVGETVKFTSNLGIIGETAKVDSAGRATVTLRAAPVNGTTKVEATAVGRNLTASTEIVFSGVTLQLATDRTEYKTNEQAVLEAFLKDASGNAIGGDTANFRLTGTAAAFDNGNQTYTVVLNPNGRALVRVAATTAGTVKVFTSALNTSDSVTLVFSNNTLSLASQSSSIAAGGSATTILTATYVNGSGTAITGETISFGTNAGTLSARTAVTDGNGRASVTLTSAPFSGTATVQANAATGSAQAKVEFHAGAAANVKLSITADNIAVNGGVATLRALVTDAQNNTVSGQDVTFRILKGPGGGEAITKPLVQSQGGVALSQLQAGNVTSGFRGVLVEASIGADSDTSKLTISGPPHIVTVARPEDDTARVPQGGIIDKSVFEEFIGAVVQDINGNMVADGTEVHFSAAVSGMAITRWAFAGWLGLGTDSSEGVRPTYRLSAFDLPFEDMNDNKSYDAGIDLVLDGLPTTLRRGEDRNGDGVFDWRPDQHAFWKDFNGNGVCDAGVGEPFILVDSVPVVVDLNRNGFYDASEVLVDVDPAAGRQCTLPASGDFPYHLWEDRTYLPALEFLNNEFAVAVEVSAVTKNGVAQARVRYPRQFAGRLYVTIYAEANGVRDGNGERFLLDKIVEE